MPDPASPQGPAGGQDLYSPGEFAAVMRKNYPELAQEKDDNALTSAVLRAYPEFKAHVQDPATLPRVAPPELQPPPLNLGTGINPQTGAPPTIGPVQPGERHRFTPMPGEFGFETGLPRMKAGLKHLLTNPFDGTTAAVADVVGGGMTALEPTLLPAAAVAPIATIAAVTVGSIAQKVVDKASEWLGLSPPVRELAGDVAALAAGAKAGHVGGGPPTDISMPRNIRAETRFMGREDALTAEFGAGVRGKENLQAVEDWGARNRAAAAEADRQAKARATSTIALKAAQTIHQRGAAGAGPFAYLDTLTRVQSQLTAAGEAIPPPVDVSAIDSFRRVPPMLGEPPPSQRLLPEQAGPSTRTPQNFILGAEPGAPIEAVGEGAPRISQPTPEGAFASQQLADLIDRARTDEDRKTLQAQQERYTAAHKAAAADNASEMAYHTYDPSGRVIDTGDRMGRNAYRAVAGSDLYYRVVEPVVGKNPTNQPPRALITDLMQAYADTGATSSKQLPKDYLPSTLRRPEELPSDLKSYYTSRGFRNQYDRYIQHIIGLADDRARSRVEVPGSPPPEVPPEGMPSTEDLFAFGKGPEPTNEAVAGQPPPKVLVEQGEMPADWLGLPPPGEEGGGAAQPTATFLGYTDPRMEPSGEGQPQYNISGGPSDRSTVTGAEAVRQLGAEVPETPTFEEYRINPEKYRPQRPSTQPGQPPPSVEPYLTTVTRKHGQGYFRLQDPNKPRQGAFTRLFEEEGGYLILNVAPGDRAGLERWMGDHEQEYGGEEWYRAARDAMAAGDFHKAYYYANAAAARSFAAFASTGNAPRAKDFEPIGAPPELPSSFFERAKGEGGFLMLDIKPGDRAGMQRWLKKQEGEYGDQDWYQAAVSAMEAGDVAAAWRVASIAAARSFAMAGAGAGRREGDALPGVPAADLKSSIEAQMGEKLPHGTTIGEGGVVKLPGNPGGLNPKYTDLVLGKNFVKDLTDLVDPSTIVRVETEEGKLPSDIPKELRISYQMADQILRQMPEDLLEPFLDETGLDRAGAAAHLARAASQAGKTLATFKHWQDAHWDEILHLNPELAGTRGPGAAGRLEFAPEERQAQILDYLTKLKAKGKATPEMQAALKDMGFELPPTIKPETKEATTYTRRWLTKQRRLAEMAKTLDIAAQSGDDFDRVAAASALGLSNERSTAGQIFDDVFGRARLSFMLSQASTAMKILESHGLRYNLGMLEEVLSGTASRLLGKHEAAGEHFSMAREMSSFKPGTFPTGLARKPWTDNLGEMFNYTMESVSGLEENDRRRALSTLEQFPREEARMTGAALLGETPSPASKVPVVKWLVDPRVRNILTVGIRAQSAAIRSALYDATLRSHILAAGDEPADILGAVNPGQALLDKYGQDQAQRMVGSGVAAALNYTYAGRPLPDSLPGKVIDMMSSLPIVSTMLRMEWAFPRFQFATVPRWLWDRVPGTLIFDLMAKKLGNVGRLAKGAERVALERDLMPTQMRELNTARYESAKALQDTMAARLESREAAQGLKSWQAKIEQGGMLPEVLQGMQDASEHMQAQVQVATEAARAHKTAEARVSDLLSQLKKSSGRAEQLQEIDAPSFEQYLARQAVGVGLLMPLALSMRNSKGAEDTEYYQYKVGGKPLDMRPFLAGFGPFLLYADFFSDVAKHTDWDAVQKAHEGGADWMEAFGQGYQGKYTSRALLADTMEAWLTIHPLFGTASYLVDALSGKQAEGGSSQLHSILDEFLATTGQAIGSFFLPLQTVSDLAGAVRPEEAVTRTPERPGQYTGAGSELTEPAQSHVPFAREALPPRINPFTGQPRELEHPALHQLLGTTFGAKATPVEEEITRTGLKPGLALPRVSGDAEFDNKVNTAYAQILKENFGDLLKDPDYQRLPAPHRRDLLESIFKGLKAAAYATVAEQVGEEAALGHLRPDQAEKIQRWTRLLEQWAKQDAPAVQAPDSSGGAPPETFGAPPPAAP